MKYPTRFQLKTLWSAGTGVAILILGSLLIFLIWLVGQIFGFLQPVLVPLIVAGIIAYLLDPVVRWLQNHGLNRMWATIGVLAAILIAGTLLVAAVLPAIEGGRNFARTVFSKPPDIEAVGEIASQVGAATAELSEADPSDDTPEDVELEITPLSPQPQPDLAPALARALYHLRESSGDGPVAFALTEITDSGEPLLQARNADVPDDLEFFWRTRAGRTLFKYKGDILQTGKKWLTAGSSKFLGFLGLVLGMIMVPIYLFFFLKDSVSIRDHWHEYVPLRASRFKTELVSTLQEINGYLISFFRGQVVVGVIDGVLVGIALFLFDLPYALLIGVFMALLGIIPYIGNILCLIPACIIAYLHAQTTTPFGLEPWPYVGCVVLIFAGVQQINSLVTAPKIVGDSVGLHPLTVIFSMLFWSLVLGGFVGALLAVPLTAAVKVIFRRYFWERTMRESSQAEGFVV